MHKYQEYQTETWAFMSRLEQSVVYSDKCLSNQDVGQFSLCANDKKGA